MRKLEVYSEPGQTSKMDRFAFQPITIFAKRSNLDLWQGSEFAPDSVAKRNIS